MSLPTIDAVQAKRLINEGAVLVDIRAAGERAREHVPGTRHHALSNLSAIDTAGAKAIIFHCRSGARTAANAGRLARAAGCDAYLLQGGIEAWKKAGLPVATNSRQPIAIMRQVQVTAGCFAVLGVVLGLWVTPAFLGLSAFVGIDLVFAGVSGWCGMAKLLRLMPWNRPARAALA